uniref:Dehydrogenase, putative n=1 Tax=Ixodes scapularis TaxID=6945 RepID=A0A1S4KV68_IXOSC
MQAAELDTMSGVLYWVRLFAGGICLPLVFPYVVYKLYRLKWGSLKTGCLQDKVVLITGASSGLGEALAHKFYAAGCKVILASRRVGELERVRQELLHSAQSSRHPALYVIDGHHLLWIFCVSVIFIFCPKWPRVILRYQFFGPIAPCGGCLRTVDVKLMMVNYFGHVALTKAVLPSMLEAKEGCIVAISSVQGKVGLPFRSAYAASKHATQAFFDTLLSEVAHKDIHVCVVSPGYIRTNLSVNALTGSGSTYGVMDETTATGMAPEEVADAVLEAVVNRRTDVVVSAMLPRVVMMVRVLWPWLYFAVMKSRAKRLRLQQQRTSAQHSS